MLWVKRDRGLWVGARDVQGSDTQDGMDGKEDDIEDGEEGNLWHMKTFLKELKML